MLTALVMVGVVNNNAPKTVYFQEFLDLPWGFGYHPKRPNATFV
jgi:hypothetical protein